MNGGPGTPRPRVLMVGPYEMDSDFDQIFLLITEHFLHDVQVITSGPIGGDLTAQLNRFVLPYEPLLNAERFDAIWTVGGGLGGATQEFAYLRAASPALYWEFQRSSAHMRQEIIYKFFGDGPTTNPYIPSPLAYQPNGGTVTVLNSAGIRHILDDPSRREEHIALLRNLSLVSVRDKQSSNLLKALEIEHRLAPDLVHAVSLLKPADRNPDSNVAIIQVFGGTLDVLGAKRVAEAIARSNALHGLCIRVLHLKTFWAEDSVGRSEELVRYVKEEAPNTDIEVVVPERPLDIVENISQARVVICDDQHVRIAASSYNIPRVLLWTFNEASTYHEYWDPDMPCNVMLDGLDEAISSAIAVADDPRLVERSEDLTQLAFKNLEYLIDEVIAVATTESSDDRKRRLSVRCENANI